MSLQWSGRAADDSNVADGNTRRKRMGGRRSPSWRSVSSCSRTVMAKVMRVVDALLTPVAVGLALSQPLVL